MTDTSSLFEQSDLQQQLQGALLRITNLEESRSHLESENQWLREQLASLKRAQFGKKSERWESTEQLVFNEVEAEAKNPEPDADESADDETIDVPAHKKKRGHRRPLPENLPREVEKIELKSEELFDVDGNPLKIIGWEKSEKLKYEPAKMSVLEIHRAKYGVDSGDYVKTAPPAPSIIPKGLATPELLAAIAVAKFADGLPLYRMEEIFKRQGVDLSRTTMARWMVAVAEALTPIWNVLADRWRDSFYVACDETNIQVLKENGRKAEDKSWMIVRATPHGPKKVVLFDYSPSRSQNKMMELIEDYQGYLQVDGLNSYDKIAKSIGITRLGCNMHARRRFESAAVDGAKSGKSLGAEGMKFYKDLYDIEEEIRDKSPDVRFIARDEKARPIFEKMKEWVEANKPKVPTKSKIGGAFNYFLNEYEYLTGYLKDGRLEMDNGFTERAIRKFAIGRNNWMFSDTVDGAKASALLYSLVITAKVNGVNPYAAMVKLCAHVPTASCIEDYERLAEIILAP
jgi:transposase